MYWVLNGIIFGLLGWCLEIMWTAITDNFWAWRKKQGVDWRLRGHTYLWMLPVYGGTALGLGYLHDHYVASWPIICRGLFYTGAAFFVEASVGLALRHLIIGRCPWDYSHVRWNWRGVNIRFNWRGVVRLDYAPVWFAVSLLLENLYCRLIAVERLLRTVALISSWF